MSRRILFLDDNEDLRKLMALTIKVFLDVECLLLASVAELEKRSDEVLRCSIAILDINLGPQKPSGVEAYDWLQKRKFAGAILFLTGHARSDAQVQKACERGAQVLEKPIPTEKLINIITKAISDSEVRA